MSLPELPRSVEVCRRHWEWLVAAVLVPVAWLVHAAYGMAWDDAQHAAYGGLVLEYFRSGFTDMRWRDELGMLKFYGTLFDLPSAMIHRALGVDLMRYRPFLMAVSGILAVPAVAGIGRIVGGERCAALSVAALVMMPQFVGQSFINCKDLPLATAFAWSCLLALRLSRRLSWRNVLAAGCAVGAALSIRLNGGMLALAFLVALLGFGVVQRRPWRVSAQAIVRQVQWPVAAVVAVAAVAFACLVAVWPYAHRHPLASLVEAFRVADAFPESYAVLFAGQELDSSRLPWHYLPTMLVLTAPLTIVVPCLAGAVIAGAALVRHWRRPAARPLFLLLLWVAFPIAYVIIRRPNIYDGVRHFLFVLPAVALLAGIGLERVVAAVSRLGRPWGVALVGVWVGVTVPLLATWHPYQYTFHNLLAGDRPTLHERFETDYWMTSYREAATHMNALQSRSDRPLGLIIGANQYSIICFAYYADPRLKMKYGLGRSDALSVPKGSDYFVTIPRYGMWRNYPESRVTHEIRRCGALMCTIKQGGTAAPRPPAP
jgi:4-amino-4-deoxy-L-arabinose transferase-like glycosyltransferase